MIYSYMDGTGEDYVTKCLKDNIYFHSSVETQIVNYIGRWSSKMIIKD